MFEKAFEKYKKLPKWKGKIFMKDEETCFKDGAKVGYNKCKEELNQKGLALQSDMDETIEQNIALKKELEKANEWHYVKEGDLPKDNKKYWILTSDGEPNVDIWLTISWVNFYDVIAWKEIVLPELKEIEQ